MNIRFSRLLMAPVLAGALFGVTMMDTQGTVEAAGPRWKGYAKPSGGLCNFYAPSKKVDDPSSFHNNDEAGSVCANDLKSRNWIGIKQYGKFNQANAALFSQNIVQLNNVPNGSSPTNEANDNYVGVGNNTSNDGNFVQANINVNKNRIKAKDHSDEVIKIEVEAGD